MNLLKVHTLSGMSTNTCYLFIFARMRFVKEIGQTLHYLKRVNVAAAFNEKFPVSYTRKQFKNHWDAMKGDRKLFTKLRRGHTGIGWNEANKSIDATDDWWNAGIKENEKYSKFRGVDLSLFWFSYDMLFSDIVATGERAHAPNQQSADGEQSAIDEEFVSTPSGEARREDSGDSDEELRQNNLFPDSNATQKQESSGIKRKKSRAEISRKSRGCNESFGL